MKLKETEISVKEADCIRLVQITDTHIFASRGEKFSDMDTELSLAAVIDEIRRKESIDLVLASGDLVHDPLEEAYARLRSQLQRLMVPVWCLPGNHDDPDMMKHLLNQGNLSTTKIVRAGQWQIILLDSFISGSHGGRLSPQELVFFRWAMKQSQGSQVLVCLHHHPVSIASSWMDGMMLENPAEFFSVLDEYKHARGVIWGHIHQEFRSERNGVVLYGSPSTCVQFKPGSESFARDELGPAYSVIELYGDGRVSIRVQRIE